jgi:site-specific DNA-cytosine methylase
LILLENVPRIQTRGKALLRKVRSMLHQHGYVSHGGTHNCGELGNLAQNRERFLLIARHRESVPGLLYQPRKQRVRGCGEVLALLPLPGDPSAGALHVLPRISWLNWMRLALIPPGGDWRDLPKSEQLSAAHGPSVHDNKYIVFGWSDPSRTVTGATRPGSGAPSVADVRFNNVFTLHAWDSPAGAVTGGAGPSSGGHSVGDVRVPVAYGGVYGVADWRKPLATVTGRADASTGTYSIADVRVGHAYPHSYGVRGWSEPTFTIAGMVNPGTGAYSVADVRITCTPRETSGAYGVIPWGAPSYAVTGAAQLDNGWWAVSDPRVPGNPQLAVRWRCDDAREAPPFVPVLPTEDGTWHRPLTTLELAALQGLPTTVRGEPLRLAGRSVARWRERIGNAVPPPTARAIAEQMLMTLVQADCQSFALSSGGSVWVAPADYNNEVHEVQ